MTFPYLEIKYTSSIAPLCPSVLAVVAGEYRIVAFVGETTTFEANPPFHTTLAGAVIGAPDGSSPTFVGQALVVDRPGTYRVRLDPVGFVPLAFDVRAVHREAITVFAQGLKHLNHGERYRLISGIMNDPAVPEAEIAATTPSVPLGEKARLHMSNYFKPGYT